MEFFVLVIRGRVCFKGSLGRRLRSEALRDGAGLSVRVADREVGGDPGPRRRAGGGRFTVGSSVLPAFGEGMIWCISVVR